MKIVGKCLQYFIILIHKIMTSKRERRSQQLDTTQTANRTLGRTHQNDKGIVSAFEPFESKEYKPLVSSEDVKRNQIGAIVEINRKYSQLLESIFDRNVKIQDQREVMDSENPQNRRVHNQRETIFKEQCLKYLKNNHEAIRKLEYLKQISSDWKIIDNFFTQESIQKENQTYSICNEQELINRYKQKTEELTILENNHEQTLKHSVKFLSHFEEGESGKKLTKTEKQYKRIQRKVRKQMEKVEYYDKKAEQYRLKLQNMQKKIDNAIMTKQEIEVKLIQEEGMKRRNESKSKGMRAKSVMEVKQKKKI